MGLPLDPTAIFGSHSKAPAAAAFPSALKWLLRHQHPDGSWGGSLPVLHDRVADLIEKGKSLAEVKAARLTRDYDGRYSQPTWTGDMFVEAVYKSLKPAASQGSR